MEIWKKNAIAVGCAWSRKEAKHHGEGGIHGGASLKGLGVAIVDDVITSGGSIEEAFAYVLAQGGYPTVCVIGFDRMERGVESDDSATKFFSRQHHIPVIAAAKMTDLIDLLEEKPDIHPLAAKTLPLILAYQKQYGAS